MALKTKLGKAEYDALEESLKSHYIADGEGYKLDADYEDVSGLKAKRDELLAKVSDLTKLAKQFEGLDPEKAKEALDKLSKQEDDDLLTKRKYDELLEKRKSEWEAKEKSFTEKIQSMVQRQAEQELAVKLTQNGVKPTMAEDLASVLTSRHIKFEESDGKPVWKTMDGLEAVDLDKYIPGLKENGKADYFGSTLAQGAGTPPGSQQSGGGAKTMPESQFDSMSPKEQAAFINSGGSPV